ncbi:hypothetical protein ONZ45_g7920 [Pleurotus djamor]|nr:hypothetical protein ONZ45_g7920 [Pleurotus djamor]
MRRSPIPLVAWTLLWSADVLAASPPVRVSLQSVWPASPPMVEILETVAMENSTAFFTFLDVLTDPEWLERPFSLTPEALHQASLEVAKENGIIRDAANAASVEMNLALHAATPKIEAFYHHYTNLQHASEGKDCGSWVDWYGQVVCDVETLAHLAAVETIDPVDGGSSSNFSYPRPKVLPFDHTYPLPDRTLERPPRTAILYASFSSPNFRELHTTLFSLSSRANPHIEYIVRHVPPPNRQDEPRSHLSGYGVALDLKKTDYLVVDDRQGQKGDDSKVAEAQGEEVLPDPVLALLNTLERKDASQDTAASLSEEEIGELGSQATQLIASSDDPLAILTQLSQNFPRYATSLSRRVEVNDSVRQEIASNQAKVQGGINMMWLNGLTLQEKDLTPFALLGLIKKERQIMESLTSLGLSNEQALNLLTHQVIAAAQSSAGTVDGMFDASDRPEGGDVIVYWNDMEKDKRYARWNPSLMRLMHQTYPGMFHNIRLNLYNIILAVDLSDSTSLEVITGPVSNIIERDFPFRFGIVPIIETENGFKMAKLVRYLVQAVGRKGTMSFLRTIQPHRSSTFDAQLKAAYEAFQESLESNEELKSLDEVFSDPSDESFSKIKDYCQRLGITLAASSTGHAFINGKHFNLDDNFLRHLQTESGQQTNFLQEKLYTGELTQDSAPLMATYFYDLPTTAKRRNRHIYASSDNGNLRIYDLPSLFSKVGHEVRKFNFVVPKSSSKVSMTTFVIADFDTEQGLRLVAEALKSLEPESLNGVAFLHNPSPDTESSSVRSPTSWLFSHLVSKGLLSKAAPSQLLQVLTNEVPIDAAQEPLSREDVFSQLTGGVGLSDFDAASYASYVKVGKLISREIQLKPGEQGLLINGRVLGPLAAGDFIAADFAALEKYEYTKRTEPVVNALADVVPAFGEMDLSSAAVLTSMASSAIAAMQVPDPSESGLFDAPQRPRQRNYRLLEGELTTFTYGDAPTAMYHLGVLIDPLSETAQKWSSILKWISNVPGIFIEVHVNPARTKEMPLKRFYRYNLIPSLAYDVDGYETSSQVIFEDLPIEPIYTLAMDVPPSWLVRPREALYDLDNIQLGRLSPEDNSVDAVFALDYLVVEGHARDSTTNAPPRGVQLELIDADERPIDDTLVVANLGYVQFKAKPGVFQLQIRPGRGRDVFEMESVGNEGWDSATVQEAGNQITVTSFEGLTLYPRLRRREGMDGVDVLADSDASAAPGMFGGFASKVFSMFAPKETKAVGNPKQAQAEINIFTVASGLLYERFASIMILSVLRNTKSTVKFWFIENFLSPSFLEFIPHFAEEYGFQYELVTYKWPSWLRQQKEKQRVIWAYKILFLDVLFPMDLKKVIFVDADQIVRADLKELVDLDMHGAPYAYTPMGDDNYDMEGFRFWKTGYWKDFLQGRPYHISALYVVDLIRFRQIAAGDMLRGQYQQLSADPNSLANLDQDLPNNLQREVPIFSLHEDWLWCETWCSKDRLHRAKTIDLCQNPLTKEPKLSRARQIPEWEVYDDEISRFAQKLAQDGVLHSRIAAADTRVLADAGTASSGVSEESIVEEGTKKSDEEAHEAPRDEL